MFLSLCFGLFVGAVVFGFIPSVAIYIKKSQLRKYMYALDACIVGCATGTFNYITQSTQQWVATRNAVAREIVTHFIAIFSVQEMSFAEAQMNLDVTEFLGKYAGTSISSPTNSGKALPGGGAGSSNKPVKMKRLRAQNKQNKNSSTNP